MDARYAWLWVPNSEPEVKALADEALPVPESALACVGCWRWGRRRGARLCRRLRVRAATSTPETRGADLRHWGVRDVLRLTSVDRIMVDISCRQSVPLLDHQLAAFPQLRRGS